MSRQEYTRVLALYGTEISLISNDTALISDDEYFRGKGNRLHSLLSNFLKFDEIEYTGKHDYSLYLFQKRGAPFDFHIGEKTGYFSGDLLHDEYSQNDKRLTIFGNMGIFSKILVGVLERKGIFSFHSTSFYDPDNNRLYLVLGSSGSGKSTVLLAAIEKGYQVFGTELTHFCMIDGKVKFLKGSVYQNCRIGNLVEDFPALLDKFSLTDIPDTDIWNNYISVNFQNIAVKENFIDSPEVVIIFPRIESDRKKPVFLKKIKADLSRLVFDSLSEKISAVNWIYGKYLIPDINDQQTIVRRKKAAESFCQEANIVDTWDVLSGPKECLDEISKG